MGVGRKRLRERIHVVRVMVVRHIISLGIWIGDLGVFSPETTIHRSPEMSLLGNTYMYFHFSFDLTYNHVCMYLSKSPRNPEIIPC